MKKIVLLLISVIVITSCSAQLTEKVVETYPDGKTWKTQLFDKKGVCVREVEYYTTGQVRMEGGMKDEKREGEWKQACRQVEVLRRTGQSLKGSRLRRIMLSIALLCHSKSSHVRWAGICRRAIWFNLSNCTGLCRR